MLTINAIADRFTTILNAKKIHNVDKFIEDLVTAARAPRPRDPQAPVNRHIAVVKYEQITTAFCAHDEAELYNKLASFCRARLEATAQPNIIACENARSDLFVKAFYDLFDEEEYIILIIEDDHDNLHPLPPPNETTLIVVTTPKDEKIAFVGAGRQDTMANVANWIRKTTNFKKNLSDEVLFQAYFALEDTSYLIETVNISDIPQP